MKKVLLIGLGVILALVVLGVGAFFLNGYMTTRGIEQEWQAAQVDKIQDLGTTHTFEILPLFEAAASQEDLETEAGVAYLVKTDNANILLDVGWTPARLSHNMQALNVTEEDFDVLMISHLHPDHMGGTEAWWSNTLVAGEPPMNLEGKQVLLPRTVSNSNLNASVHAQPTKTAQGVATFGTLPFPEVFPVSLRDSRGLEQALAVNVEGKGIVLITGCGHPTVEQIVKRAQATFDEPIVGIVGGLHYVGQTPEQVQSHIEFIKKLDPQLVAVSPHDSSADVLGAFRRAFPNVYRDILIGQPIRFDEPLALGQ